MKKLRIKLFVITLLAMLAFVGVGFASWTFQNQVATDAVTATPQIKAAVELSDDFKLYNAVGDAEITNLYLICDAPTSGNSNVLAGHGVYWSTSNNLANAYANKIENVYIKGTLNYDANDIADLTSVTVTFTNNCTLTAGTYVEFGTPAVPAAIPVTIANGLTVQSATFALPVPSYKDAVDDFATVAQADTVTAGLAGLVVSYKAQITDKVETEA